MKNFVNISLFESLYFGINWFSDHSSNVILNLYKICFKMINNMTIFVKIHIWMDFEQVYPWYRLNLARGKVQNFSMLSFLLLVVFWVNFATFSKRVKKFMIHHPEVKQGKNWFEQIHSLFLNYFCYDFFCYLKIDDFLFVDNIHKLLRKILIHPACWCHLHYKKEYIKKGIIGNIERGTVSEISRQIFTSSF